MHGYGKYVSTEDDWKVKEGFWQRNEFMGSETDLQLFGASPENKKDFDKYYIIKN